MSPERIRDLLEAKPFQPFTLVTGDGEKVDVLAREFAILLPGGRTLTVVAPKFKGARDEDDFAEHKIDVFLITKVTVPYVRSDGRRKAS